MIKNDYSDSEYKLLVIEYTSDEICKKEFIYYNEHYPKKYTDCMVFRVTFRAPRYGDYFYEPNQIDQIGYWFVKKIDGEWECIGTGRPVP